MEIIDTETQLRPETQTPMSAYSHTRPGDAIGSIKLFNNEPGSVSGRGRLLRGSLQIQDTDTTRSAQAMRFFATQAGADPLTLSFLSPRLRR